MLLRLSLIVAILAGGAALYFSHVQVADKITGLQTDLTSTKESLTRTQSDLTKARRDLKNTQGELADARNQLDQATNALQSATKRLADLEKHSAQLDQELTRVKGERNEAQADLAAWKALGISVDQIKALQRELADTIQAKTAFAAENTILNRKIGHLESRLAKYEGGVVELPAALRGKVLAVDPKYDFVVLDIGENQGVKEYGQLLVNRNGKLVAKLEVTRVQPDRSIANILPQDKLGDVEEGDEVITPTY